MAARWNAAIEPSAISGRLQHGEGNHPQRRSRSRWSGATGARKGEVGCRVHRLLHLVYGPHTTNIGLIVLLDFRLRGIRSNISQGTDQRFPLLLHRGGGIGVHVKSLFVLTECLHEAGVGLNDPTAGLDIVVRLDHSPTVSTHEIANGDRSAAADALLAMQQDAR